MLLYRLILNCINNNPTHTETSGAKMGLNVKINQNKYYVTLHMKLPIFINAYFEFRYLLFLFDFQDLLFL